MATLSRVWVSKHPHEATFHVLKVSARRPLNSTLCGADATRHSTAPATNLESDRDLVDDSDLCAACREAIRGPRAASQ